MVPFPVDGPIPHFPRLLGNNIRGQEAFLTRIYNPNRMSRHPIFQQFHLLADINYLPLECEKRT